MLVRYSYENLSYEQFETLIVLLCKKLFGTAVQGFAKGPDGGRDAKFVGKAERFPSTAEPWIGTTIIQAKHTNGINRSFSETDFYSPTSTNTILDKEILRIKKLRDSKELDNYILFANRRLTANTHNTICSHLAKECNIPDKSIYLCGLEQIELWLREFPDVADLAKLDLVDSPLIITSEDLAEVVEALAAQKADTITVLDDPPTPRVTYEQKNQLNRMSNEYAKDFRKKYLKETAQIYTFLSAPENLDLLSKYKTIVDEFQFKIIAHRKDYQEFDKVMEYLLDLLFGRDPVLNQTKHKRLTRAVLFYMYWNCDIGEVGDAETN